MSILELVSQWSDGLAVWFGGLSSLVWASLPQPPCSAGTRAKIVFRPPTAFCRWFGQRVWAATVSSDGSDGSGECCFGVCEPVRLVASTSHCRSASVNGQGGRSFGRVGEQTKKGRK